MKKLLSFISAILLVMIITGAGSCQKEITPESLGWKLAYQSFTFKNFTFEEGLQKANDLGLKYVEAYRGQELTPDNSARTHFDMNADTRDEMNQLLDRYQVKLINYGVVRAESEQEWRRIFKFASDMGVETLIAEPEPEQLDYLEQMCEEFNINLALHNHPKPSRYWSPDSVLHYISGRGNRIGACADIGHWVRSGLDPLECLKKLEGNIISLHFKDLNEKDRHAHDVPWGTGVCDVPALLQELKNQGFRGVFSVEYEHNWDNNVPEIEQSLTNFRKITSELL
jgi:sugar phosphate isomerase/epimerase